MIQWSRLLIDFYEGASCRLSDWQAFAGLSGLLAYGDHVLHTAALVFESNRDPARAIELCETLLAAYPTSSACVGASYVAAKCALHMSDRRLVLRYVDRFSRAMAVEPRLRIHWQRQFLGDAAQWRTALDQEPEVVCELLSILGSRS